MSISLIGIIFVQSFWIKTTLDNRERQFSLNVNQALKAVTESIKDREMRDYLAVYQKLIDSIGEPQESQLTSVIDDEIEKEEVGSSETNNVKVPNSVEDTASTTI